MAKVKAISISELRLKRMEAKSREKAAVAEIAAIDSQLILIVPRGEEVEGIIHVFQEKRTPSWKSIAEKFVQELIPNSKKSLAQEIIESNTTTSEVDYIKVKID